MLYSSSMSCLLSASTLYILDSIARDWMSVMESLGRNVPSLNPVNRPLSVMSSIYDFAQWSLVTSVKFAAVTGIAPRVISITITNTITFFMPNLRFLLFYPTFFYVYFNLFCTLLICTYPRMFYNLHRTCSVQVIVDSYSLSSDFFFLIIAIPSSSSCASSTVAGH